MGVIRSRGRSAADVPPQTAGVAESPDVRNELDGTVHGTALQVGIVHGAVVVGESATLELPRQLPLAIGQFTGRTTYLEALDALIPGDTVVITAVDGTAGIGKTTLAVSWAHRAQHQFPDGTLFANLRGYGPGAPATAEEVLDGFLRALGVAPDRIPVGAEAKAARFRSLLSGRQMLIVLDNAGSAEQVRPLLPGEAGSMAVVTSRDSLNGLVVTESAHRLTVDLLSESEAVELVTRIVGPSRAVEESKAVAELVRLCERLPLALRIAATRVAASPYNSVAGVVSELGDERSRLDVLSSDSDERAAVRAVLEWSYRRLPDDQAILFRRLGLHPGPEFSLQAAAAVAEIDLSQARRLVGALVAAHLTEPVAHGRYRCHDLLRAYATELAEMCDSPATRREAVAGLASWYARIALVCDKEAFPGHIRSSRGELSSGPEIEISGWMEALNWLDLERANLISVLRLADACGLHVQVIHLAECVRFMYLRGGWREIIDLARIGVRSARVCGDRIAECWFYVRIGETSSDRHAWSEAASELGFALVLASGLADVALQGIVLTEIARLDVNRGRLTEGLELLWVSLPMVRQIDGGRAEAVARTSIARTLNGLGRHEEALRHGTIGLALRRQALDTLGEPYGMRQLAVAWQGLGDDQMAIGICRDGIARGRMFGSLEESVADTLSTLAVSLRRIGREDEAIACWREAAALFEDFGRPWDADEARANIG